MARMNALTDLATVIEVMEVTGALKGKSVSITGHLARKRDDVVKIIQTAGGSFDEQPKWNTTYLVTNKDWNKGSTVTEKKSSKLIKAEQNGTRIITEQELYDMIMGGETFATLAAKSDA